MGKRGAHSTPRKKTAMDTFLSHYQVGEGEDDEEDTEEEEQEEEDASGWFCCKCEDELMMTDEIFLLRVVAAQAENAELQMLDILEPDGDYAYAPAFFCFDCWEEALETLQEQLEDIPPVVDHAGCIECDICRSDILLGETLAVIHFGELHWSERAPSGFHTPKFVEMQKDVHVCLSCLHHMEEERREPIWEGGINPMPDLEVCVEGLHSRCWRYGNCTCQKAQFEK